MARSLPPKIACFGEVLLRFSAPIGDRLLSAPHLYTYIGGAELNVASALSVYDLDAKMVSVLPDNALGQDARRKILGRGLDGIDLSFAPGRIGLYFQEPGSDLRVANIVYDRAHSAFANITPDDLDANAILEGCNWLHISGVTLALGEHVANSAIKLAEAAAAKKIDVSFDFNHRAKLWAAWGGEPAPFLRRMMETATVMMGNDFDLMKVLDQPEARATRSLHLADIALASFPRLRAIASAYRTVERNERHHLRGELVTRKIRIQTDAVTLDNVVDRVGGGDAFAAGLIASFIKGSQPADILQHAFASMILKHGWRGDVTQSNWEDVINFDIASGGDVKR